MCSQPLADRVRNSCHQQQASSSLGCNPPRSKPEHEQSDPLPRQLVQNGLDTTATQDEKQGRRCQEQHEEETDNEKQASQDEDEENERRDLEERKARRRKRLAERKQAAANSGYYQPILDCTSADQHAKPAGEEREEEKAAAVENDEEKMRVSDAEQRRRSSSSLAHSRYRADDADAGEPSTRLSTSTELPEIQMSQQEIVSQQGLSQRHNKRSYKDKMRLLGLG